MYSTGLYVLGWQTHIVIDIRHKKSRWIKKQFIAIFLLMSKYKVKQSIKNCHIHVWINLRVCKEQTRFFKIIGVSWFIVSVARFMNHYSERFTGCKAQQVISAFWDLHFVLCLLFGKAYIIVKIHTLVLYIYIKASQSDKLKAERAGLASQQRFTLQRKICLMHLCQAVLEGICRG